MWRHAAHGSRRRAVSRCRGGSVAGRGARGWRARSIPLWRLRGLLTGPHGRHRGGSPGTGDRRRAVGTPAHRPPALHDRCGRCDPGPAPPAQGVRAVRFGRQRVRDVCHRGSQRPHRCRSCGRHGRGRVRMSAAAGHRGALSRGGHPLGAASRRAGLPSVRRTTGRDRARGRGRCADPRGRRSRPPPGRAAEGRRGGFRAGLRGGLDDGPGPVWIGGRGGGPRGARGDAARPARLDQGPRHRNPAQ
jgi:hypothetical protein